MSIARLISAALVIGSRPLASEAPQLVTETVALGLHVVEFTIQVRNDISGSIEDSLCPLVDLGIELGNLVF